MSDKKVLMVCLGNTCRSTIAEAIFNDSIIKMGLTNEWKVDSAGLRGYHIGQPPDERAMMTLRRYGILNYSHKARVITSEDFFIFDWILSMDDDNMKKLNQIKPRRAKAQIELLGKYNPGGEKIIRDPYGDFDCSGFVEAYEICLQSIDNFLGMHSSNSAM